MNLQIFERLPVPIIKFIVFIKKSLNIHFRMSYSQEGEDMILRRFFEGKKQGFFIDVGAYQPKRFSNTYYFYKKGWKGINIDAMPGSMKKFKKQRPRDINLEFAISDEEKILDYYVFMENAYNSLSENLFKSRIKNRGKLLKVLKVSTKTLEYVLNRHLPENQDIDFLNIDVEGFDLKVLKSNNWLKYRPNLILVEDYYDNIEKIMQSEIYKYLMDKGYFLFAKTVNTMIYKKAD